MIIDRNMFLLNGYVKAVHDTPLVEGAMLIYMYIVPNMLTELLYPLQNGHTPLHLAAERCHTACVKRLLSTPGIDVNIKDEVFVLRDINNAALMIYNSIFFVMLQSS